MPTSLIRERQYLNRSSGFSQFNAPPAQAAMRRAMATANKKCKNAMILANEKLRKAERLLNQEKAITAVQAKNNLKKSIHKVLNLTTLTHQNQFRPVVQRVLNFVSEKANSRNLANKAQAILTAYNGVGGNGGGGLSVRKKIAVLKKLVELMKIYSKSHGNAFYTAAFNRSLGHLSFVRHFL